MTVLGRITESGVKVFVCDSFHVLLIILTLYLVAFLAYSSTKPTRPCTSFRCLDSSRVLENSGLIQSELVLLASPRASTEPKTKRYDELQYVERGIVTKIERLVRLSSSKNERCVDGGGNIYVTQRLSIIDWKRLKVATANINATKKPIGNTRGKDDGH